MVKKQSLGKQLLNRKWGRGIKNMATKEEILTQIQPGKIITAKLLTDMTNLAATAKEDIKATLPTLQNQVNELSESITEISDGAFIVTDVTSNNLLNYEEMESGYYWTNGHNENPSYMHSGKIPVSAGDTITYQYGLEARVIGQIHFIVGFDVNNNIIDSARSVTSYYTVPQNVSSIIVTMAVGGGLTPITAKGSINKSITVLPYEKYHKPYKKYVLKNDSLDEKYINELVEAKVKLSSGKFTVSGTIENLLQGNLMKISEHLDVKKNKVYRFFGGFNSFASVTIGHGYNTYGGSWVTIDETNVTAYYFNGSQAIQMGQYAHNLTISDFIDVVINVGNVHNLRASVTVMTKSGDFTQTNVPMAGCNGAIFSFGGQSMTNVKYSCSLNDMLSDVWLFGDSYISLGDTGRWTYQLMQYGYKDLLMCGFGGATSSDEILAFRELTEIAKPKYLVWALGMNDADANGSVNTIWKSAYDEVKTWCEQNSVEFIPCTIPNTPRFRNIEKNNIVRTSELRYIDFAKAVNAEEDGATWYPNMLSSDNVHPVELGAKVLANRFLVDVPEVFK